MATPMGRLALAAMSVLLAGACRSASVDLKSERIAAAERYLRGVYGADTSVVDDLAGPDITMSYPVIESLYGTPALRGREAVKVLVTRFGQGWADPHIDFSDAISDGNSVALLWSFRARNVGAVRPDQPADNEEHSWGGITLVRFDGNGKIVAEIGEESEPGPIERLRASRPEARRD
jgi:hypothetical protein